MRCAEGSKTRSEPEACARALVDARRSVTHAATAAAARLAWAAHHAERRRAREARRRTREARRHCCVAPFDERPDQECDGATRRAAPPVDAVPSDSDAAPAATAPSPIEPMQASPPSAPTPSPLEHKTQCHSGAAATAMTPLRRGATTTPRVVTTRIVRRAWPTETMRGCFREVLLLVVCALTLLGPSVYLYARDGGFVRAAPPAPPAAAATARLAALEAAAQSASTALAGVFAEGYCWVG